MTYFEDSPIKTSQYKIQRQIKPFVDNNLQFQYPGWEFSHFSATESSHSPIYAHYMGPQSSYLSIEAAEAELNEAMKNAERSYNAWKKMQRKLKENSYLLNS